MLFGPNVGSGMDVTASSKIVWFWYGSGAISCPSQPTTCLGSFRRVSGTSLHTASNVEVMALASRSTHTHSQVLFSKPRLVAFSETALLTWSETPSGKCADISTLTFTVALESLARTPIISWRSVRDAPWRSRRSPLRCR